MGRAPCCDKDDNGLKKGPWTAEEDGKLISYIRKHGQGNWRTLPKNAGLQRCGKSCRLRWTNYLRPDIKRGRFSFEEEETIIQLHSILGNRWSAIAARLPGRTDNEIKNYWNTHIRKRLLRMGMDPVTHAPRLDILKPHAYYPTQAVDLHTLRTLEPFFNSEILRLASSLLQSSPPQPQHHNPTKFVPQDPQMSSTAGVLDLLPLLLQAQIAQNQLLVQSNTPICNATQAQLLGDQAQLMQANATQLQNMMAQADFSTNNCVPASTNVGLDPSIMQWSNNYQNYNLGNSGLSTPASSPIQFNSSPTSTYVNGSTDIDSSSYSNGMFNPPISELLDVSDYLLL